MASFLPILKSLELACIAEGILVPGELFWRQSHQNNTALPRYSRQLRRLVIARNRGHFAPVINCQRNLVFKMADKNYRSQGKRIPRDFLNNLSSVDLFYEEKSWN